MYAGFDTATNQIITQADGSNIQDYQAICCTGLKFDNSKPTITEIDHAYNYGISVGMPTCMGLSSEISINRIDGKKQSMLLISHPVNSNIPPYQLVSTILQKRLLVNTPGGNSFRSLWRKFWFRCRYPRCKLFRFFFARL